MTSPASIGISASPTKSSLRKSDLSLANLLLLADLIHPSHWHAPPACGTRRQNASQSQTDQARNRTQRSRSLALQSRFERQRRNVMTSSDVTANWLSFPPRNSLRPLDSSAGLRAPVLEFPMSLSLLPGPRVFSEAETV